MRSEYDFSGKKGVRGKYYRDYRRGHTVRIHKANGTGRHAAFHTSGLISLIPHKSTRQKASGKTATRQA